MTSSRARLNGYVSRCWDGRPLGLAVCLMAGLLSTSAALAGVLAGEWTLSGGVDLEPRYFFDDPAFPGQLDGEQLSLVVAPELRWRSGSRKHQVTVSPWARWDDEDDERTHADLREASYRYVGDRVEIVAGVGKVFWGVAESRHLVDVINQTDAVEEIDEEDKLGQPMLQVAFDRDWGRLELFALPGFRERTFAGVDGRLRPPLVVDTDNPLYESGAEEERVDWAVRWSHYLGDWDVGVHAFHGTGREPQLVRIAGGGSDGFPDGRPEGRFVPFYALTTQFGVDVQYTRNAWLFKLESIVREGQGDTFSAFVGGFEYTLYQLGGSAADLGLLAELHHDGRDETAPFTIYDDDLFLGARLALNDVDDTSLLIGGLIDEDDCSVAGFLEAERRLSNRFKLELEARLFSNVDPAGELGFVGVDDFVTLRLAFSF